MNWLYKDNRYSQQPRKEDTIKITTFNPLVITKDPEYAIKIIEDLGFERHHTKENIGETKTTDVRMKNANGFMNRIMTNSKYESIDGGIAPDTEMIATAEDGSITATLYDPKELTAAVSKYYDN